MVLHDIRRVEGPGRRHVAGLPVGGRVAFVDPFETGRSISTESINRVYQPSIATEYSNPVYRPRAWGHEGCEFVQDEDGVCRRIIVICVSLQSDTCITS